MDTVTLVLTPDEALMLHDILVSTWFPKPLPILDENDFAFIDKLNTIIEPLAMQAADSLLA